MVDASYDRAWTLTLLKSKFPKLTQSTFGNRFGGLRKIIFQNSVGPPKRLPKVDWVLEIFSSIAYIVYENILPSLRTVSNFRKLYILVHKKSVS